MARFRSFVELAATGGLRRQLGGDADVVHDVRHAARMLRRSPAFTVSAVVILGVGIGGTVAIVSLLDALLLKPLPYHEADRVVTLWQRPVAGADREDVAPANFLDWRERARSFERMAAAIPYSYDYTGGTEPEVFFGAQVTEGFFDALGVLPILGRTFRPEEHVRGARPVVIITHGLWQRRFGGSPGILDQPVDLEGVPFTVVGVLPREFAPQMLPRPGELGVWTPKIVQEHERRVRGSAWWNVVARLRPDVSLEAARAEMRQIASTLAAEHPRTNASVSVEVLSLRDHLAGSVRLPLLLMFGGVLLVLLIGCANVASLLLARGLNREREFAIRAALGAGRWRLIRQLGTESLVLSLAAALLGVATAHWVMRAVVALAPPGVARLSDAAIDARTLGFALLLACCTAFAFGLFPAFQFSRPSREAIRERQGSVPRAVLRRSLVAGEVALALVLLAGAGLLVRSFQGLLAVDPGFSPAGVVALQVFAHDRNGSDQRARQFFRSTLERMQALPGVRAVGAVSAMPFISANIDIRSELEVVGRSSGPAGDRRGVYLTIATPGYFDAMSVRLREGRRLSDQDDERSAPVAVISEALRRREWPAGSPLGERLRLQWQGQPIEVEVVGVVSEIRHDSLSAAPRPEVFVPHAQVPFASMTYVLRGDVDPAGLIEAARHEVWAVDPLQTFYDTASVERLVAASLVRQRFSMMVMSTLGIIALLLCATGIYGIISFTTTQRTREIGVRMALGARPAAIQRMVMAEGARLIATGLAAGVAGAMAGSRLLRSLLFEVRPGDPLTFVTASTLLAVVGLVAVYLPARRATKIDPLVALRTE